MNSLKLKKNSKIISILFLSFIILAQVAFMSLSTTRALGSASIKTNRSDYSPQETVYISGSNFLSSHAVTLTLTGPTGFADYSWTVTTNDKGKFQTTYSYGLTTGVFILSATDGQNRATTTFTDFALESFVISPNPSIMPLLVGNSYTFNLTATLPGNSGSNGVNVYVKPEAGPIGATGITISYVDVGFGISPMHIPANGKYAIVQMTIEIPSEIAPGPLPLTVTAYDNPGGGGTIIGSFTVTLHVNQIPLVIQTSGLYSPTNISIGGTKVGTAYDGFPYGPQWFPLDPETGTVTIGAIGVDNTVSGTIQYFFSSWSDGALGNNHPSITTSDPITLTANYVTRTSQITITSSPTGSNFINVDATTYIAPHTFTWAVGSTHALQATSTVAGLSDVQYVYSNWSDNGAQAHQYTVTSTTPTTITANYKTQYSITLAVTPSGAGSTSPSSGTSNFVDSGTLSISAAANAGYHFDNWSSSSGSIVFANAAQASTTASINGPGTITANFAFNPVTHFSVTSQASTYAGSSFPVTVTALDASGNTVRGYAGTILITSSDLQAILPADATLTNGVGIFMVTLKTSGSQLIIATDHEISGSTSVSVLADKSSTRFVIDAPVSATAGIPFTFTVTAKDNYGNTVTDYTGTIHFTSTSTGSLPSDSALSSGTAAFSATLTSSGTKTITATDTVQPSITGSSNIILIAPADQVYSFSIVGYPSYLNAGQSFDSDVIVTAYDIYGNVKTNYDGSVYFTSSDSKANLPFNSSIKYAFSPSDAGTHIFSGSKFSLYTMGTQTITITDGSVSKESNAITVNYAAEGASYFVVDTPGTANAGSIIPIAVTAKDKYANTVSDYSGTVIFTSTDATATLPNSSTLDNGVGNFIATFKISGSQTITATDSSNNNINGTSSVVIVGPALSGTSAFIVDTQPTAIANSAFSVKVTAVDMYENLVASYSGAVHLSSSDTQSIMPPNSTLTEGTGIFIVTLRTAGTQIITAYDVENSLIEGSATVIVTVDPSSATHFDVNAPSFVNAGQSFTFIITAKDQFGNIVTGYSGKVHFSSSDAGSSVNLPLDYMFTSGDQGYRQFTGLKLVTAGSQTVTATDALTEISGTGTIQVTIPINSADHLVVSAQNSVIAGVSFVVTVTAKDAFDNTVTGYTGTVHFISTDHSAILPFDYSFQALDSGSKAFDGVILETAGLQTVTAADIVYGSISGTSGDITVAANSASPSYLVISPASAQIQAGESQAYTAELFDIFGNSLGDVTQVVAWSIDDSAGGTWEQATGIYTSAKASPVDSPWIVTATINEVSGHSLLTVIHATDISKLASVTISPSNSTIAAGQTESYTATAADIYGNSWDVTADVSATNGWAITTSAGGMWNDAIYTSEKAGDWTVTVTYLTKTDDAILIVTPNSNSVISIDLSPKNQTIIAGGSQEYTAIAIDSFGNTLDVSTDGDTIWAIDSAPGTYTWSNNVISATKAGIWTISVTYHGATDNGTLTVMPKANSVINLAISPKTQTIAAGESIVYTATATDSYGNSWDVANDKETIWTIDTAASGSWNQASYTSAQAGIWTVAATYKSTQDTALLTVTHATDISYLDHITASLNQTTVAAPNNVTGIATAYDIFGNNWDISSTAVWSILDGNDGGSWLANVYTSNKAGTYTIQAYYQGKTATAMLEVTHAIDDAYLDSITIAPKESTVNAGVSQTYTATAKDTFDNTWSIIATYSCSNNLVAITDSSAYSNTVGSYLITGSFKGKTDTATLNVIGHLPLVVSITVAPRTAVVAAGTSQAFKATASDGYNSWDVTGQVSWSILESGHNGSWSQTTGTYTSSKAGIWTVKAALDQKSDIAQLTVNANPALLDHITISPKSATMATGSSQTFSITAYDQYTNSLGDVTPSTTLTAPGAIVLNNSVSANSAGTYTVTATYNGKTDTASISVTSTTSTIPITTTISSPKEKQATYTTSFTEYGLPIGKVWNVTFNGQTKSTNTSTIIFTVQTGSYQWSVQSPIALGNTRYIADYANGTMKVQSAAVQIVNFTTQYYLDVQSRYGNITGAGWYNANSKAQFSVTTPSTDDSGNQYAFAQWNGIGKASYNGNNQTASVTMSGPITEIAEWDRVTSLWIILLVALIIFGLLIAIIAWRKRKKKNQSNQTQKSV